MLVIGGDKMAQENTKDFNAMLHDSKDMPKLQIITDAKSIERYGGRQYVFCTARLIMTGLCEGFHMARSLQ